MHGLNTSYVSWDIAVEKILHEQSQQSDLRMLNDLPIQAGLLSHLYWCYY